MAGRRRRATSTTSTVATIDDNAVRYYKENTFLKPVSPRAHSDDWPCFLLTDATVYHRNGALANLLHVDLEGPFIIRGKVVIDRDQEKFMVNRYAKTKSLWIQIHASSSFSIGLKDEGAPVPVLWASGEAGWYEIIPAERYGAVCDHMFQGISLFYAVQDQYFEGLQALHRKKKHRGKTLRDVQLPLDTVLFKYAVTVGDGVTLPEAYQRCTEQAVFLLSHFPRETAFHDWLQDKFPALKKRFAKREAEGPIQEKDLKPSPLDDGVYAFREISSSLEAAEPRKRGRPRLNSSVTRRFGDSEIAEADVKTTSNDEDDIIMIDAPGEGPRNLNKVESESRQRNALHVPPKQPPAFTTPHTPHTPSNNGQSSAHVLVHALNDLRNDLLQSLQAGLSKKHPDQITAKGWKTKLYQECSISKYHAVNDICIYYARDFVQLLGPEWHGNDFYRWARQNVASVPSFELMSEQSMRRITRRVRKDPKGPKDEGPTQEHSESSAAEPGLEKSRRGRPSGKVAILRPSTGSKKRMRHETGFDDDDMEVDEYGVPKKTSKRSRFFADDEIEEQATQEAPNSSEDEDQTAPKDASLTRLIIRAEKLPSTTPTALNQTWVCEEPDCGYIVRGADEKEGQDLINAHHEDHDREGARVNLALQESSRGHMPINHLLDKIRSIGEKAQQRDEVRLNGEVVPQPIKRTLFV